jgi:hypothetical protein
MLININLYEFNIYLLLLIISFIIIVIGYLIGINFLGWKGLTTLVEVKSNLDDYYKITDSYNINSILENSDLINIIHNNPYFKLELLLFLGLCFLLYIILSLTIVTLINKYNYKIKEYFKNKYILMYINFNNKYINYIICFWFLALYLTTFLLMAISYTLIYGFETYCV